VETDDLDQMMKELMLGSLSEIRRGGGRKDPMASMMTLMMMKMMAKDEEKRARDDDGETEQWIDGGRSLDGLRAMRALARSREVTKQQRKTPTTTVTSYLEDWEQAFDAAERGWTWREAAKTINWRHFRSMHRVFLMLGAISRLLEKRQTQEAHLLVTQCQKATHQMALDGHWSTSWKFVEAWVADPYKPKRCAATEVELEAALGAIKVEEDLARRTKGVWQWPAEEENQPQNEGAGSQQKGNRGKKWWQQKKEGEVEA
jgi:hypothetical protein